MQKQQIDIYKPMEEPISNDKFIEWTSDIFKDSKGPRKIFVMSIETAQYFIDRGVPPEYIDVLGPPPKKKKCYRNPK